jgi:hypothetical protein
MSRTEPRSEEVQPNLHVDDHGAGVRDDHGVAVHLGDFGDRVGKPPDPQDDVFEQQTAATFLPRWACAASPERAERLIQSLRPVGAENSSRHAEQAFRAT